MSKLILINGLSFSVDESKPYAEYVVGNGDTLSAIATFAKAFGTPVTWQELAAYNGIKDANKILSGQTIRIPNWAKIPDKTRLEINDAIATMKDLQEDVNNEAMYANSYADASNLTPGDLWKLRGDDIANNIRLAQQLGVKRAMPFMLGSGVMSAPTATLFGLSSTLAFDATANKLSNNRYGSWGNFLHNATGLPEEYTPLLEFTHPAASLGAVGGIKALNAVSNFPNTNFYLFEVRPRVDATKNLFHWINEGRKKLNFLTDGDDFYFGKEPITEENSGLGLMLKELEEHNVTSQYINLDKNGRLSWVRFPMRHGSLSYYPNKGGTSFSVKFPKVDVLGGKPFGEARISSEEPRSSSMILTSPRTDAQAYIRGDKLGAVGNILQMESQLPNRIDRNIMKTFWQSATRYTPSGTYVTGDSKLFPLGYLAIDAYESGGLRPALKKIFNGGYKPMPSFVQSIRGLSPDSYMAFLKLGQRPEWNIEFSMDGGFGKWNNSAVDNAWIYNAWEKARSGTLADKQNYVQLFNDWVRPFGGAHAYINDRGVIIHPHPWIVRNLDGGTINYLNSIK